jgi:transcriptional repressor NrdR
MKCPFCSENRDRVVDSRESRDGATIRRRRECVSCGRRFTSYEQIDDIPYMVVKHDGSREEFSRKKLLSGLRKACEKRPVAPLSLEAIADAAETMLHDREEREISTHDIGACVMEKLRELDQVAYVRFASVYRRFEDLDAFMDVVKSLLQPVAGKAAAAVPAGASAGVARTAGEAGAAGAGKPPESR